MNPVEIFKPNKEKVSYLVVLVLMSPLMIIGALFGLGWSVSELAVSGGEIFIMRLLSIVLTIYSPFIIGPYQIERLPILDNFGVFAEIAGIIILQIVYWYLLISLIIFLNSLLRKKEK